MKTFTVNELRTDLESAKTIDIVQLPFGPFVLERRQQGMTNKASLPVVEEQEKTMETQEQEQTPKQTVEQLIHNLLFVTHEDGLATRLLLVKPDGDEWPVRIASSPTKEEFKQMFEYVCNFSREEGEEREARRREVDLIIAKRATLIKKIHVLMERGYVPVGLVVPDCIHSVRHLAGYLPDGESRCILEAFCSGYAYGRSWGGYDLGTVERAKKDLEVV